MLLITLIVVLVVLVAFLIFSWGHRRGGRVWSDELVEERKLKAKIVADRDAALAKIEKAKALAKGSSPGVAELFKFL